MNDEVHDTSRLDAYMRARRRVALLNASWKPMAAGAAGAALIIAPDLKPDGRERASSPRIDREASPWAHSTAKSGSAVITVAKTIRNGSSG